MKLRLSLIPAMISAALALAASAGAAPFFFTTGTPDGQLGALSRSESPGKVETETADDFVLTETTVINGATITGLIKLDQSAPSASIGNVEVEVYRVFAADSDTGRTSGPPTFSTSQVLTRVNSPSDVEIDAATRDGSVGTLSFSASSLNARFTVANTVLNGINTKPSKTGGEGPVSGEAVQITITFTKPILLPAGRYFFRPEVLVNGGDFLYLSAPKPIVSPGTPLANDLQAWIRNSRLAPDWLRIGTDIVVPQPPLPPTFNMTFSLAGNTLPEVGTPGEPSCHGETISALASQFGGIAAAASTLGFSSVNALQDFFKEFCKP
jgi:hypothetical protein